MNAKEEATARLIHCCDKHHEHEIYRCPECKRFNLDIEIEREPVWHCHSGCSKEVIQNAFYDQGLWASKIEIKAAKSDLDFPLLRANGITVITETLDEECYDARWLTDNEPEPRDWTIKPILPAKELSGLTGPPGSGKTYAAIMMGLGAARGEFNGSPCKKANVMYVTREESLAEIHRRIKTQTERRGEPIPEGFFLQTLERQSKTWLQDGDEISEFGEAIFSRAENLNVELIIFEMLPDFFAGNEIDRQQVNTFFKGVVAPRAKRAGCACLFLMHPSVAGLAEGSGRSGSTANFGSLRSVLFQRQTEAGIAVKLVKANYAPNNQEICTLVWNDLLGGFDVGEALPPEKKPPSGSNQKKIFELLPDDGSWISQKKVQRTLEMKADRFAHARMGLIKRGCLEVSTDGQQMRGLFDGAD